MVERIYKKTSFTEKQYANELTELCETFTYNPNIKNEDFRMYLIILGRIATIVESQTTVWQMRENLYPNFFN